MHVLPVKSVSIRSAAAPQTAALTALFAGLVLLISACGQKGPLTLPAAPAASSAASAPTR